MSNAIVAKRLSITIKRDLDTISTECFEHELPVFKKIHLAENIVILEKLGEVELEIPVQDEYIRMERRFCINAAGTAAFRRTYPEPEDLAEKLNAEITGAATETQQFMHKVHKPKASLKPKAA